MHIPPILPKQDNQITHILSTFFICTTNYIFDYSTESLKSKNFNAFFSFESLSIHLKKEILTQLRQIYLVFQLQNTLRVPILADYQNLYSQIIIVLFLLSKSEKKIYCLSICYIFKNSVFYKYCFTFFDTYLIKCLISKSVSLL